ncbi:MAG TPA: LysM domain-containing protein [Thermoleophilaceae bacterium]|jgi:LysM repeat protein
MSTARQSPARLLAPIALVAFGLALVIVLASGTGGDDGPSESATKQEQRDLRLSKQRQRAARRDRRSDRLPQGVYVVKTGDTLGGIAQKTGIPVERLQELNPELDPQALVSGQKIKLKE